MANSFLCSIPDCDNPARARGWCTKHYQRWKHHGDPQAEVRKRAPDGAPLRFYKDVALTYDGDDCLTWPYGKIAGRAQIIYEGDNHFVARLLCEHVYGPPPSPSHEAAHSCGHGHLACINRNHLRWATRAENVADKLIHGTHNRGERHPTVKLTETDIHEIRRLRGVETRRSLAKRFGVSHGSINDIYTGRTWAWLT